MCEYKRNCSKCGVEICYSEKWSRNNAEKKGTKCFSCVRVNRGSVNSKYDNEVYIRSVKDHYYDLNTPLEMVANKCGISFNTLKKIIKKEQLPKLTRNIKKWDRSESYKKIYKSRYGIPYQTHCENKSDFERYRSVVRRMTELNIKILNGFLESSKLKRRGKDTFHVDHIVSVFDGFNNNVPPFYLADVSNLRMLSSKENTGKSHKSDMDLDILISNILFTENNEILISDIWHNISS